MACASHRHVRACSIQTCRVNSRFHLLEICRRCTITLSLFVCTCTQCLLFRQHTCAIGRHLLYKTNTCATWRVRHTTTYQTWRMRHATLDTHNMHRRMTPCIWFTCSKLSTICACFCFHSCSKSRSWSVIGEIGRAARRDSISCVRSCKEMETRHDEQ